MFYLLLFLFPILCFAQINIVSNYPLKKNNILSIVNSQNIEAIVSMLSSLEEVKSVKVKQSEGKTLILVERYPTLSKIVYKGLNSFSQEEVNAYLGLVKDAPIKELNEEDVRLRLEEFYKDRGFLDANARVSMNIDDSGFVTITIQLFEGPLYFTLGAEISSEDENLKKDLKNLLKPIKGRVFREGDFRQEVFKLQDYLIQQGYFDAFVYYTGAKKVKLDKPFFEVIIPGEEKPLRKPLRLLGSISEGFNNLFEHPIWTLRALAGRGFGAYATYTVFPGKRFQITFEGAKSFSPELLLKKTGLRESGIDPFSAERASFVLEEFYRSKGFLDVKIKHLLLENGVFFEIEEGDRYLLNLDGIVVGFYDQEFLERELKNRLENLKSQGFVLADGRIETQVLKETKTVIANFIIEQGPKQFITSIKLEGGDEKTKKLFSKVEKKLPLLYDARLLEELNVSIKKNLAQRGFLKPYIEQDVLVSDLEDEVHFSYTYRVSPGDRFEFGETVFYGYNKTVGNELSYMNTRAKFYSDKLTENALYNFLKSGIFSGVEIKTFIDEENKRVHRLVVLSEEKRGSIDLSLGYNTEEKFFAEGIFNLKNLFGIGASSVFSFRRSSKEERFKFELSDEFLFSSSLFAKIFATRTQEERRYYKLSSDVGGLQIGYRLSPSLSMGATLFSGKAVANRQKFNIEKLTAFAIFEKKDDIINPKRLSLSNVSLSRSFSKEKFWKLELSHFELIPLDGDLSLSLKIANGFTTDRAPIFERFFLGGLKDLRGFESESVGPSSGGKVFVFSRLEAQKVLKSPIVGAIFTDVGNAEKSLERVLNSLKYNFGLGLGVSTPLGPARFDVSYAPQIGRFGIFLSVGYFY